MRDVPTWSKAPSPPETHRSLHPVELTRTYSALAAQVWGTIKPFTFMVSGHECGGGNGRSLQDHAQSLVSTVGLLRMFP